ncbi:RDD family protein [Microbacterium sp. PMB16]|uniref:RDD family protein n=1 Tax=Microbacterium sp. PMB16 TaxID=3120157 RepID=UPI003F4BCF23
MIWEIDEQKQTIEGLDASGRPDPAYAAALGLLRAPFGRRFLAATYDIAIWLVLQLPLWLGAVPLLLKLATGAISSYGLINHPGFVLAVVMAAVTTLFTLIYLVVQLVLHGRKGRTIGKGIAGIRSVNVRTLERPGVGAVLLRFLIVGAAGVLPLVGPVFLLISPTFDPEGRGRGLHDKAAKVWLVDVRNGLNPYDEKRMRVARKVVKAEPTPERSALPSLATPIDPGAQPEYRPGSRVSAGVLGVARPYEPHERPSIGLSLATPTENTPIEAGKPVLGGYRVAEGEAPAAPAFPVVPVVPEPAPQQEAAPAPAPQAPAPQAPAPQAAPVFAPAPAPVSAAPAPAPVFAPAPASVSAAPAPAAVQPAPPAAAPQPAAPQPAAPQQAPRFGLRFDTGESILISDVVLLGRNPDAAGHPGARAIALTDDSRSLSKTHMLVRPVEGGLEITDCRSTNGSGLIRDGAEYGVAAGTPVMTTDGDMIRLGDRVAAVVRL